MIHYRPAYKTDVQVETVRRKHNTMHTDYIDWDSYPFDDPEHGARRSGVEEQRLAWIEEQKAMLRQCEQYRATAVWASSYSGWPRIWHRVVGVGMASAWPYWRPRPTVLVTGPLGIEWIDWLSLTGAKVQPSRPT